MSHFRLNDDPFFSPVRLDVSSVDGSSLGSEGSLNDFSNVDEFLLTSAYENKIIVEENVLISDQIDELKNKDGNTKLGSLKCTPVNKNCSDKSAAKRKSLKLKLEKKYKNISVRRESIESNQKKPDESYKKNTVDSNIVTCDTSDDLDKKCKSASLPSKKENAILKDVKKKQKAFIQSSKCDCTNEVQKLKTDKQSVEEKSTENSSDLQKHTSDINCKDSSVTSTESKENTSKNKESNYSACQKEKSAVNEAHSSYEESIKKMIHSSISSESAKLRQHMYMQQMSFYREMNKIKDSMAKQHFVTTERLFKVIEELMQMNASLKLALASKD